MRELEKQISNASFKIGFRGYQPGQVDAFLDSLQDQARTMDDEMRKMESEVTRYREMTSRIAELTLRGGKIPRLIATQEPVSPVDSVSVTNPVVSEEREEARIAREQRMELALRTLYSENRRLKAENHQLKAALQKNAD